MGDVENQIVEGGKLHYGRAKCVRADDARAPLTRRQRPTQDFEEIKSRCLEEGVLFEDPEFPAVDSNVYFSPDQMREYEWLRPGDIVENPQFFVEGSSRFDVKQGELGDCWFLAAVANLTLNETLFHMVVPEDNSFDDYCGVFHFRFWQYGAWVDVVIDDRLPTRGGQLVFMHSDEPNEFWSALIEKAYAKLNGSYEALDGGRTYEALVDFSGGVAEIVDIKNFDGNLFSMMEKAFERNSFLACGIQADPYVKEAKTGDGLVRGHAYSITSAKNVELEGYGEVPLIRIRNPWGDDTEWKGAWSDGSPEWGSVSDETKEELGLTFDADGEFWIGFHDFVEQYSRMEICNLSASGLDGQLGDKAWKESVYEGHWVRGATAGGCINNMATYASNPQFTINLEDADDGDENCTLLVALMQKNRRAQKKQGKDCLSIGFSIYALEDSDSNKTYPTSFFRQNRAVASTDKYINLREVTGRFALSPGPYLIVPTTFYQNEEAEFILRVFTETGVELKENDEKPGIGDVADGINEEDGSEEEEKVREFFSQVAGEDEEVDWRDLKKVLDMAFEGAENFSGFSRDVSKSLVALMDYDVTGKLGFEEFMELWKYLFVWARVFMNHDQDKSGHLSGFELREALGAVGYHVNKKILEALILRYGDEEGNISMDEFVMCAIKLKTMIETFQEKAKEDEDGEGHRATFTIEEWIHTTLYS